MISKFFIAGLVSPMHSTAIQVDIWVVVVTLRSEPNAISFPYLLLVPSTGALSRCKVKFTPRVSPWLNI